MPHDPRRPFDAIVIGAGHNGLTAAACLARAGLSTVVLERRAIVGGCCVTEEIAPGCRASTTSYIASMLCPEVIQALDLPAHGLRMVPCNPALVVPFTDGSALPWWTDRERTAAGLRRYSARDAARFIQLDDDLKKLARHVQAFFLQPPPDVHATGVAALVEILKVGRRLRGISGREITEIVAWLTGSLADLLHRHFESDQAKALLMANTVYGKHGGPYQPGSALGLLFHLLNSGAHDRQGFSGHVIGGMGAITRALAAAARQAGADVRTSSAVGRIDVRGGRVRGVLLENGTEIRSRVVLSNADPKRTCLDLLEPAASPTEFRQAIAAIRMNGPCAKVNLVLDAEPHVSGIWGTYERALHRAVFTLVPSLEAVERCYDAAKLGAIPDELWIDCVVASNVDETLAPRGRHVMTCFVQYVPYRLRDGTWDEQRDLLGDRVVRKIGEYAPNVPGAIIARQVLTPLDLEREYGLTEGNIFHGDLSLDQLFFMRPIPGWSRYRLPIAGLYLCGAGAHPGGGVTGIPGYNAARQVIADLKRRRA